MAISTLGLTQALTAAGQDYNSSYLNAYGTVYSRNLAAQKQASESKLQAAQSNWYNGRNQTAQDVASTRAAAMGSVATIKAGTVQAQMRDNALKALPGDLANLYYEQPETVKAYTDAFDRQNGTSFSSSLFPGMGGPPASSPASSSSPASGPGAPQFNPITSTLGPAPMGSPGVSQTGVPGAPPAPASFSAPGVGLSGMGRNTAPAPMITGVSPALPPPSGLVGNMPAASPSAPSSGGFGGSLSGLSGMTPSGVSPTLPPPSVPIGTSAPAGSAPPLVNPLRQPPLVGAKIAALNAGAAGTLSKTDMLFQNSVGLLPLPQQAQATARFNQINGTNYAVPGVRNPTLPDGTPVLGPPTLTPPYTPNAMQAATIAGKNAQTNALGQNYGLKVQQFKSLQDYQNALVGAKQQEIGLQRQGLSEKAAHDSVMANIAQQGVNARGNSLGGNGVAGDALTARLNQRMTTLTMPGKPDMFGKPSAPLVTLDTNGNPTGPGAHEYHQLQSILRGGVNGSTLPANPVGGGFGIIPGAGKLVQGISAPSAGPLPALPPRSPGAASDMITINGRTATRAQWAAEMAKPGRR